MLERVVIVAGESSGELYGALLAERVKARNPGVRIVGVGGERMAAAGVELISGIESSFGITEALRALGALRKTFNRVLAAFAAFAPQAVVLIDYPDFNMRVAREAKRRGIKVLYYVSPQVWAWRTGRARTLGALVDGLAVILPFETDLYRSYGIPCEFVGHPVVDEIRATLRELGRPSERLEEELGGPQVKAAARKALGLEPERPVITVMPGSRPHEVQRLLPLMTEAMEELSSRFPGYQFVIPQAPNLESPLLSARRLPAACTLVRGQAITALLGAEAALIASGTSTLQAGLIGVPAVVVYKLSPLSYFVGKRVVKVRHVSLVNILLDKSAPGDSGPRLKELLQGAATKKAVVAELSRILDDAAYRAALTAQLRKVRAMFLGRDASSRVAELLEALAAEGAP